jgi:hypothetical protein
MAGRLAALHNGRAVTVNKSFAVAGAWARRRIHRIGVTHRRPDGPSPASSCTAAPH